MRLKTSPLHNKNELSAAGNAVMFVELGQAYYYFYMVSWSFLLFLLICSCGLHWATYFGNSFHKVGSPLGPGVFTWILKMNTTGRMYRRDTHMYKHVYVRSIFPASSGRKITHHQVSYRGSMQHLLKIWPKHQLFTLKLKGANTWEDKGNRLDHHHPLPGEMLMLSIFSHLLTATGNHVVIIWQHYKLLVW